MPKQDKKNGPDKAVKAKEPSLRRPLQEKDEKQGQKTHGEPIESIASESAPDSERTAEAADSDESFRWPLEGWPPKEKNRHGFEGSILARSHFAHTPFGYGDGGFCKLGPFCEPEKKTP